MFVITDYLDNQVRSSSISVLSTEVAIHRGVTLGLGKGKHAIATSYRSAHHTRQERQLQYLLIITDVAQSRKRLPCHVMFWTNHKEAPTFHSLHVIVTARASNRLVQQ
jgi:hypothetical protein